MASVVMFVEGPISWGYKCIKSIAFEASQCVISPPSRGPDCFLSLFRRLCICRKSTLYSITAVGLLAGCHQVNEAVATTLSALSQSHTCFYGSSGNKLYQLHRYPAL